MEKRGARSVPRSKKLTPSCYTRAFLAPESIRECLRNFKEFEYHFPDCGHDWKREDKSKQLGSFRLPNSTSGPSVVDTSMGSKLFITLGFVIPFHFIKRIADKRTKGLELPATLGATEALKILFLNPFQCALHCRIVSPAVCLKQNNPSPAPTAFQIRNCGDSND